ncbi:hypothetical protein NDS46_05165 [Paenibacillus thiaminolyticus]|uniref:hypothetical protein n=1 Tax=Paenibacillus thiaminolyticus TaxID=49283 RepID=UPI00232FD595|nr:hypothetical protein [Paenibacillus thiaminolyticus]WCF09292.1 hypothetical protein NDS46_05165 [Paenibacillus thiaminolyticus]
MLSIRQMASSTVTTVSVCSAMSLRRSAPMAASLSPLSRRSEFVGMRRRRALF